MGQPLPIGAAGSLVRSVAYFDGGGATSHLLVLAVWIVAGVALAGLGLSGVCATGSPGRRRRSSASAGAQDYRFNTQPSVGTVTTGRPDPTVGS